MNLKKSISIPNNHQLCIHLLKSFLFFLPFKELFCLPVFQDRRDPPSALLNDKLSNRSIFAIHAFVAPIRQRSVFALLADVRRSVFYNDAVFHPIDSSTTILFNNIERRLSYTRIDVNKLYHFLFNIFSKKEKLSHRVTKESVCF